jgi:hypothetical protein
MSEMMTRAAAAVNKPEVQEMLQKLAEHGLGVFIPHMHTENEGFEPLPSGMVQMESDLVVTFVPETDPVLKNATMVGWVWDKGQAKVVGKCACRAMHYPGNCSYQE